MFCQDCGKYIFALIKLKQAATDTACADISAFSKDHEIKMQNGSVVPVSRRKWDSINRSLLVRDNQAAILFML